MNSNKKSTSLNRQAGFKPVVAQLKTPQGIRRPVAPPVYRPTATPNTAQLKKLPVAPPVYRPESKKIVQPKTISQQVKFANSIRPITAKTTAFPFRAVQMAAVEKKAHACSAKVVATNGEYTGDYDGMHAEINALEKYFASGGGAAGITRIELSSACCKYCAVILSDLGILDKVVTTDHRKYGRCQGGSYGWFARGGSLWKAIKAAKGCDDEDDYAKAVCEQAAKLK